LQLERNEALPNLTNDAESVLAASRRIAPHIRRTPILDVSEAGFGAASVCLKLELLQHSGSFKARGAFNAMLAEPVPEAGVSAASGGNHGAAVAYAAQRLGHRACIFVPASASAVKIERIRGFGASVTVVGRTYAEALALSLSYAQEAGSRNVHAYDEDATIHGQATLGLEWAAQAELDSVIVAVGGGGLIAGLALGFAGTAKITGVEPYGARALHAALAAGEPVDVEIDSIAADSLGAQRAGRLPLAIAQRLVERVVLVEDQAIIAAQAWLWQTLRIASEPGGATALAALLSGAYRPAAGERVGVLICGGNVDLNRLAGLPSRPPLFSA
jgi:threonine dehydratase